MITIQTLCEIFYSGTHSFRGDKESMQEIAFLLNEGYLTVKNILICYKKDYLALLEDTTALQKADEASGGSLEHIALKILSQRYLEHRKIESSFEQPFCGYYPDVLSKDSKVVVECGHTQNVEKILAYFTQGASTECIQVPYPDSTDEDIVGHQFTPSKELKGFLTFLEAEKRADIKRILNRT